MQSRYWSLVIVALTLLGLASATRGIWHALFNETGSRDFQWDAIHLLVHRENPYAIALGDRPAATDRWMADTLEPNQLPSALALLWPFGLLSWPTARLLWTMANLAFTILLLLALFRWRGVYAHWRLFLPLLALFLASTAWRNHVSFGQHTLFSLSFFSVALWLQKEKRGWLSGLTLALSLFKYTTVFPLALYFLYWRAYRPLLLAAGIHVGLTLWVSWWLNESPIVLIRQSLANATRLANAGHLDLSALLTRFLGPVAVEHGFLLTIFLLAIILLIIRRAQPARQGPEVELFTFLCLASTVVVYHRFYDLIVLVYVLFFIWSARMTGV